MAYSYKATPGDGSTTIFNAPKYLKKKWVKVFVDGVETPFTWHTDSTIKLAAAPAVNALVIVRRLTPLERTINFQNENLLTEGVMDEDSDQLMHVVQEAVDGLEDTIGKDESGQFDAQGKRIMRVGDPQAPTDAMSLSYFQQSYMAQWQSLNDESTTKLNQAQALVDAGLKGDKGDTGVTGPQGPAGSDGENGATGVAGGVGPQGPIGPKGNAGSQGTKGDTGGQGPKGDRGPQGGPGVTGDQGPTGLTGSQGVKGDQGIQGVKGDKGDTGSLGVQGPMGPAGTGLGGPEGPQGVQGNPGADGINGAKGAQGVQGPAGGQGPAGEKGDTGDQGIKGDTGETGTKGDKGDQGIQGERGLQGIQGIQGGTGTKGDTGDPGLKGEQGDTGLKGDTGEKGDKGDAGTVIFASQAEARAGSNATKAMSSLRTKEAIDAQIRPLVESKANANVVKSMANREVTISTAAPSGGSNGDVWFKYS